MITTITTMPTMTDGALGVVGSRGDARAMLRLLWLASPALPVGAYGYSRGLEQAVTRGLVHDEASLTRWIRGVLTRQLATLDAPVMVRVLRAAGAERWA